jgi:hypothetical protein
VRVVLFSLLLLPACRPPGDWQPLPFQRPALTANDESVLRSFVRMSDPEAPRHFLGGISSSLEAGSWRWTRKRPELKLFVRPGSVGRLRVEFAVAEDTFRETGPVRVAFFVNGSRAGEQRCPRPGQYAYEQPLPTGLLRPGALNTLAFEVDKAWISPADGEALGLILLAAGFLP